MTDYGFEFLDAFEEGIGRFECDDVVGGIPVKVRFEWFADAETPEWRQSFSYDGGIVWRTNWIMELVRREA